MILKLKLTVLNFDLKNTGQEPNDEQSSQVRKSRLRVVSNFVDGDCGAGEIHRRAQKFEETRREGSAEN